MEDYLKGVILGFIFWIIVFGIYAYVRNYKECKLVPHTTFYCLTANN